jgi:uncharacterized protein
MFTDSGLASYLQAPRAVEQSGGLMENFVMAELARQLTWAETPAALYHYRDRDGHEVDAVLEDNSGRVVGIEVKSAQSVLSFHPSSGHLDHAPVFHFLTALEQRRD